MCETAGFHKPRTMDQARAKFLHNATLFRVNYAYAVALCAFAGIAFDVRALCITAGAFGAAAFVLFDTRHMGVSVWRGITTAHRQAVAAGLSVGAVMLSGAVSAASGGACVGAAVCSLHGAFYEAPPDFT
jgi:hypothetical protein